MSTTRRLGALAVVIGLAGPATAQMHISTDLGQTHQVIEGWGTTIGGDHQSEAWRTAYRDLGLNILRVPMDNQVLVASSTDFATPVALTDDLHTNMQLMGVDAPTNLSPNRSTIGMQRLDPLGATVQWMTQNALEPDRVKVSGSLWTPPHWMKGPTGFSQDFVGVTPKYPTPFFSDEVVPWRQNNPQPTGDSVGGRLKTEDPWTLDQYGKYIATWVATWDERYGVPMGVISLQNESTFENPFDSMTFVIDENGNTDFNQYAMGLKSVKDAWEQFGLTTQVMGPHVANFNEDPSNPYNLWRQNGMIDGVRNHADPTLIDFLDFYNANFYNGLSEGNVKNIAAFWYGADDVPANWAVWARPRGVENDGKGIWFSETGDAPEGTSWLDPTPTDSNHNGRLDDAERVGSGAITTALKIHNALVQGQASAYVYWQFADGNDQLTQHTLLGGDQLDDPLSSKKYAAFKQYSRYIRPGAVRLDAGFDDAAGASSVGGSSAYDTLDSLNVAAFFHPEDGRLTFVLLNMTSEDEAIELAIPEELRDHLDGLNLFRTSDDESFADLGKVMLEDGMLRYTVPAFSVSTFTGAVAPEPATGAALLIGIGALTTRRVR